MNLFRHIALTTALLGTALWATAQDCGPNVPVIDVDLSGDPNGVFISDPVIRAGNCCGTSNPDRCIAFIITLHPDAEGIIFDVCDGAVSPGAMYYQIGCGPQINVGESICLDGVGPHYLTFCKPGNNENVYCITSVSEPTISPAQVVGDGCSATLQVWGFDPQTIVWNSVAPGNTGQYNGYLNCTLGCETVVASALVNQPITITYQVCGLPLGGCDINYTCVEVDVTFVPGLSILVNPLPPIVCYGEQTAVAEAIVQGGLEPFEFTWSDGSIGSITNLPPGPAWVSVNDATNCPTVTYYFTVLQDTEAPYAFAGPDQVICSGQDQVILNGTYSGADGVLWSGGSGSFVYPLTQSNNIYNPSADEILNGFDLVLQTTDMNGCPGVFDTIHFSLGFVQLEIVSQTFNVTCNNGGNGSILVNAQGLNGPYNYAWNTGSTESTLEDLIPGQYSVMISDQSGCDTTLSYTVTEPEPIGFEILQHSNISCFGFSDGSLQISVWGGTAPLQVSLFNNGAFYSGTTVNGIEAGSYTLQIEDANGCQLSEEIVFTEPQPLVFSEINWEEISCSGYSDGTLTVQVSGGTPPLSASLISSENLYTGFSINNIAPGDYDLSVTDSNGCTIEQNVIFEAPAPLIISDFDLVHVSCNGLSDASLDVEVEGGTGDYTIVLNNQSNTYSGSEMEGIAPGTYMLTITDENNCEVLEEIVVTEPEALEMDIISLEHITCYGLNNGSLELEVTGGTAPLETQLSGAFNTYYGTEIANIGPGDYALQVIDANGCEILQALTFSEPEPLEIETTITTNVSCYGLSDGGIAIGVQGGTAPFSAMSVCDGMNYPGFQLNSLGGGQYAITVSDGNGCEVSDMVFLVEPEALLITSAIQGDITCHGLDNGSLSVIAQGGTEPLNMSLTGNNGNYNGFNINGISPGQYTLTVEDANGCQVIQNCNYNEPPLLQIASLSMEEISCFGYSNGELSVLAQGGTPPVSCSMFNANLMYSGFSIQNIAPGYYQVVVEDANGCEVMQEISFTEPQPFSASLSGGDVICPGEMVPLNVSTQGGNGALTYQWNQGLGNSPLHMVSPASTTLYSVSVLDDNGCVAGPLTATVEVMILTQSGLNMSENTGICPGSPAQVSAQFVGNYGPYSYEWTQGLGAQPGTFSVFPDSNTWYRFTVYDVCGNNLSDSVLVTVYELPEISLPGSIASGCIPFDVDFSDYVENIPGSTYNWNFGDGYFSFQADPVHSYEDPGIFNASVLVTTPDGCVVESNGMGTISAFGNPDVSIITAYTSTTLENPNFTLFAASDEANTEFQWYENEGEFTMNESIELMYSDTGTYFITLVGVNEYGCTDSEVIALEVIPVHELVIPNIFTPNPNTENDGYYNPSALNNDIFYPFTEYVKEFEMLIFNRWGELVFETHDLAYGWNGYYRGQLCQQDVYVYKLRVEYTDGIVETRMGDITLMR